MIPRKEEDDIYEDEGGLPWQLWAVMFVAVVAIVSLPNYKKDDEKPRENRVHYSKDAYDKVVKENP